MTLTIETKPVPLKENKEGVVLVGGTRVPLDTVVYAFRNGDTAEEIVEQYDALKLSNVYAVIAYYLEHQEEIDAYIKRREKDAEIVAADDPTVLEWAVKEGRILLSQFNLSFVIYADPSGPYKLVQSLDHQYLI